MIGLTRAAIALLKRRRAENEIPESHGIRFYRRTGTPRRARPQLAISFARRAKRNEQEIERQGQRFFVPPEIIEVLKGYVIDVNKHQPHKLQLRKPETRG
jgi:Fe-S cluster assembly iron-binding protein IscA